MENWSSQIGTNVIFTGTIKMLDKGTIGVLNKVYGDLGVIVYPQNSAYEDDGNGGYKLLKNAPNQIFSHSCKLSEITPAPPLESKDTSQD